MRPERALETLSTASSTQKWMGKKKMDSEKTKSMQRYKTREIGRERKREKGQ